MVKTARWWLAIMKLLGLGLVGFGASAESRMVI